MVTNGTSIHIQDVVTGGILIHNPDTQDSVCHATYSQKLKQLAVVTGSDCRKIPDGILI